MITTAIERLDELAAQRGVAIERDVLLGPLTTLRVGGPAQRLVTPRSRDELLAALQLARDAEAPLFVIGNGSDIVVADGGILGLVVRNRARGISVEGERIAAASGTPMAGLVKRTVTEGLAGLEFGISIPGSLGGAVWANAGAHGGEMRDVVASVETWDPSTGQARTLENADCEFGYRESRFKHRDEIVL
ncbi:MAG TPA: FAD-binding protein, partial [Candidatus Limnocylindria bacterium]|nr:FAD-binding protein [Candidatus Limnocylindria bacterium]